MQIQIPEHLPQETNRPYAIAMELVEQTGKNVFLTGKAGTGKTTFLKEVRRRAAKRMIVLAPTGIAAINAGGSTLHSFFQLPFGLYLPGYRRKNKFRIGRDKIDLMRSIDLMVIDEVSMLRADILDEVSSLLQKYRGNPRPFGGIQLLMIGDLQQLAPIVKEEEWEEMGRYYASPYFFDSMALKAAGFVCVELTRIYRQSDREFIGLLEKIRNRNLDQASADLLASRYIPGFTPAQEEDYITLTTHNYQSDRINESNLAALPGPDHVYEAEIHGNFPESSFPTVQTMRLRPGAQVMFVKNDSSADRRYYNGKIGRVVRCDKDSVRVESEGGEIKVEPESWENTRYSIDENTKEIKELVDGSFRQIPLRLAWAITIHKSQGLTFNKVVIDAGRAFAHGQVYVALSRCRTLEGIVLRSPLTPESLIADHWVDSFGQREDMQPDTERLSAYKEEYLFELLKEQFDFTALWNHLCTLQDTASGSMKNIYPRLYADIVQAVEMFGGQVYRVGERFLTELYRLRQSDDTYRNERCFKAAGYFSDRIESILQPLIPRLSVELDNRQVQEILLDRKTELRRLFREKQSTLGVVCQSGKFEPAAYLRAKSEETINSAKVSEHRSGRGENFPKRKPGHLWVNTPVHKTSVAKPTDTVDESCENSGKKGKSARMENPEQPEVLEDFVKNQALFEKLKDWRTAKYKAEGKPAFMILSQRVLIGIANAAPRTEQELLAVHGIGRKKLEEYGEELLAILNGGM